MRCDISPEPHAYQGPPDNDDTKIKRQSSQVGGYQIPSRCCKSGVKFNYTIHCKIFENGTLKIGKKRGKKRGSYNFFFSISEHFSTFKRYSIPNSVQKTLNLPECFLRSQYLFFRGANNSVPKNPDQYQYLSNCTSSPPLAQQQSTDNKLGLMWSWGRGRCVVSQILTLIQEFLSSLFV